MKTLIAMNKTKEDNDWKFYSISTHQLTQEYSLRRKRSKTFDNNVIEENDMDPRNIYK